MFLFLALLDRLGAVSERLGAILGRLGASLARLGAILGRLGAVSNRTKPPGIPVNLSTFSGLGYILIHLESALEPFWAVLGWSWVHLRALGAILARLGAIFASIKSCRPTKNIGIPSVSFL